MYSFGIVFLVKNSIYHVTKCVKRLFLQLLISFHFLKSVLDDAMVDIISKFGLKASFLDTSIKGKFVI